MSAFNLFQDSFINILFSCLPEVYLLVIVLILVCYNLFLKDYFNGRDFVNFNIYFVLPSLIFLIFLLSLQFDYSVIFFNGHFISNKLIVFTKMLITVILFFIFLISLDYFKYEKFQVSEFVSLVLLAVIGMFLLVSANDFVLFIYRWNCNLFVYISWHL